MQLRVAQGLAEPAVPPGWRRPLGVTAVVAAVGLVALGIAVAGTSVPSAADDALLTAAGDDDPELWTKALAIDHLGEPLGVAVIATVLVALCLALGRWRLAVLTLVAEGAIWGASALVKPLVDRTIHGDHLAYPSGHTAGMTAFALVVGLMIVSVLRVRRAVASTVIVGVTVVSGLAAAWAQTILVAHYATDTVGGFLLALALVPPLGMIIDWTADRGAGPLTDAPPAVAGDPSTAASEARSGVTGHPSEATYPTCNQGSEVDDR
jgi:undecaprenyl-diphosphatase